jgi:hypothetical protein
MAAKSKTSKALKANTTSPTETDPVRMTLGVVVGNVRNLETLLSRLEQSGSEDADVYALLNYHVAYIGDALGVMRS